MLTNNNKNSHFFIALASLFFIVTNVSLSLPLHHRANDHLGFTVDLVHRDSPNSPFFNPSETLHDRQVNAVRRSNLRVNHISQRLKSPNNNKNNVSVSSPLFLAAEYLMTLFFGTPPFPVAVVIDTSDDMVWTQCKPCKRCYNQTLPIFDTARTKTLKRVYCETDLCDDVAGKFSCSSPDPKRPCEYLAFFDDFSESKGNVVTDTLRLDRTVSFPEFAFGCGFNNVNKGSFDKSESGFVGLGNGKGSLVSQLSAYGVDEKFSYCMVPTESNVTNSKISFGKNAVVSGVGTVTIKYFKAPFAMSTFYSVNLTAISVGKTHVAGEYNAIIDTSLSVTAIPQTLYNRLESAVASLIKLKRVADPQDGGRLCYASPRAEPGLDFPAPNVTFHYLGADLTLGSVNTFVRVSKEVVCFAFIAIDDSFRFSVIGNIVHKNFLVGYDRQKMTISFKPTDCTKKLK